MYRSGGDKSDRGVEVMARNKSVKSGLNLPTSSHNKADVEQIYEQIDKMWSQEGKGRVNVLISSWKGLREKNYRQQQGTTGKYAD